MNDVTRHSKALAAILDHAEAHDLPVPGQVLITDSGIQMRVWSLDALTQWAMYLDETIEIQRYSADHRLAYHQVRGDALEQPIKVWTTTSWAATEEALDAAFGDLAEPVSA